VLGLGNRLCAARRHGHRSTPRRGFNRSGAFLNPDRARALCRLGCGGAPPPSWAATHGPVNLPGRAADPFCRSASASSISASVRSRCTCWVPGRAQYRVSSRSPVIFVLCHGCSALRAMPPGGNRRVSNAGPCWSRWWQFDKEDVLAGIAPCSGCLYYIVPFALSLLVLGGRETRVGGCAGRLSAAARSRYLRWLPTEGRDLTRAEPGVGVGPAKSNSREVTSAVCGPRPY